MTEMAIAVETLRVTRSCDACERGDMERDGSFILATNPPLIPHKCTACGATDRYRESYPKHVTREKQGAVWEPYSPTGASRAEGEQASPSRTPSC